MPLYTTYGEAAHFVSKHIEWVNSQKKRFAEKGTGIKEGNNFQTKLHQVGFFKSQEFRVKKEANKIFIGLVDFDSEQAQKYVEFIITEIYRFEAKSLLPGRLKELAAKFGFSYNKVTIRNNKRNWGSCSSKNNISLNLQMMKLPDELIDYILLHELVHTKIKNHGPGFWQMLDEKTSGRAKELAKQVRKYSTYTL
jgi:predicted metal-dependent hydrolase